MRRKCPVRILPLRDTNGEDQSKIPKDYVFDAEDMLVRNLNRQISSRPEVWGESVWPDDKTEQIAKFFARFCEDTTPAILRAAFVPEDPIVLINSFDGNLGFGVLSRMTDAAVIYFGCRHFTDEEISVLANQTFGDFVLAVKSRMTKMPPLEEPRKKSEVRQELLDSLNVHKATTVWDVLIPLIVVFVLVGLFAYTCYIRHPWAIVPGAALCICSMMIWTQGWNGRK